MALTALLLHEFFEASARRWPDRQAIDVPPSSQRPERRTLTYSELKHQSDALARALQDFVVEEERIVVILLPRASEHLYVAQLAVLKAGAAFACIDPAFPDRQAGAILKEAEAVAILTDAEGMDRTRHLSPGVPVLDVTGGQERWMRRQDSSQPAPWLSGESLAYLIYTSGTTGQPKGVMIEHRSIANLVRGDLETLGVTPEDRVAQNSSPAYDSSIEETWFALAAGATLVVMDNETVRLGPDLVPWLRAERITMFCPAPTLLRSTGCEHPEHELPGLRLLHPGGEALTPDVAERWARGRRLVNDYGPTETTITSLRGPVQPGEAISIGRPVPGMRAWILDDKLEEVPTGEHGELCIGGIGLARGYRNQPELTAEKFPAHPRLGRIYRSGDLASRDAEGNYYCHGRIDAQVKIRGYRIELEAIEARMVECEGVREAVCAVQGEGTRKKLVAFLVMDPGSPAVAVDVIQESLREALPEYMVPVQFGVLTELPRNTSGKVNRRALRLLEVRGQGAGDPRDTASSGIEEKLSRAFQRTFEMTEPPSTHEDFFHGHGGDSLQAAILVSLLRDDPETASLTVRDLYEARTVAGLAKRARPASEQRGETADVPEADGTAGPRPGPARLAAAGLVQTAFLLAGVVVTAPLVYAFTFHLFPSMVESLGAALFFALLPLLVTGTLFAYTVLTTALAVVMKKLLIGRYRPLRAPAWGSYYVRNWMVQRCVLLIPWRLIEITEFQNVVLRALGSRIGKRVHIHRSVRLTDGGWDLLDLGDDVSVGQDAALHVVTLESGQIVFAPVRLDNGATLGTRSGVGAGTHVGAGAVLTAGSHLAAGEHLPAGEKWDGVPARPSGSAPQKPAVRDASPALHPLTLSILMILGRIAIEAFVQLPLLAGGLALTWASSAMGGGTFDWLFRPGANPRILWLDVVFALLSIPGILCFQLAATRIMGEVRPGVISRWSAAYIRVRLKVEIVEAAGRWLCGTLLWPVRLRCAGMKIGRGSEVSTIIDTIPELTEIGPESFFADGIHLGGPAVFQGTVTLERARLGGNVFLGNHAVIQGGQAIPDGVLVGVCTVADDRQMRPGSFWFGHPPFELHRREIVECDRSLTHEPSWPRYINRVFWELLRFTLPLVGAVIGFSWISLLERASAASLPVLFLIVVPGLEIVGFAFLTLFVLATKWALLGRARPGTHPLWSCWCSRWDFLFVVWDFCASPVMAFVEGTLLLNAYLRAMGMRIGRNVVLGPNYVHVVDPDMLEFQDNSTVSCLLQAHTFEDRVLKIDRVTVRTGATVGSGALLLYGADIGEGASVMPRSVVMKRERLLPRRLYAGCPTHSVSRGPTGTPLEPRAVASPAN
jgi:non-ribosomal peptide synthetase-like protein